MMPCLLYEVEGEMIYCFIVYEWESMRCMIGCLFMMLVL